MAHDHKLEIFRGLLKFKSNVSKIWGVLIFLTLVKAYYIAWDFMHLRDERSALRRTIVWTPIFLVSYLIFILLFEADYIHEVYSKGFVKWNF